MAEGEGLTATQIREQRPAHDHTTADMRGAQHKERAPFDKRKPPDPAMTISPKARDESSSSQPHSPRWSSQTVCLLS
jgi:hypothetical protein